MSDRKDSSEVPGEASEKSKQSNTTLSLSRRKAVASLLGVGALGTISTRTRAQPASRPWNQDVDAQDHDLFDLGSLSMTANKKSITDFEGENLSIGESGELNANTASLWEDTDDDALVELPNNDGVRVKETVTDKLTVGSGSSVSNSWGDSGELVPLFSERLGNNDLNYVQIVSNKFESPPNLYPSVVPFESLSLTNVSQLYVSLSGGGVTFDADAVSARLVQRPDTIQPNAEGTVIPGTEVTVADEYFDGPKVPYDPGKTVAFSVQTKSSGGNFGSGSFRPLTINVWGEID